MDISQELPGMAMFKVWVFINSIQVALKISQIQIPAMRPKSY